MVRPMPITFLLEDVAVGCVVGAVGTSVFYFVKGTLRSSSRGCRLAGGVQDVITNVPGVRRCAAWSAAFFTISDSMSETCDLGGLLNLVVAGGAANALCSMHRGPGAAVRSGLKGAAYTGVAVIAIRSIVGILESRRSSP